MDNALNYILNFTAKHDQVIAAITKIDKGVDGITNEVKDANKEFLKFFNNMKNSLNSIELSSKIQQIRDTASAINSVNKPGMALSSNMFELSAMTGVAGDKLLEIQQYARKTGVDFGLGAAGGAESFKLVLGQLSPEIAKVPKALNAMGNQIAVTSKLMGNDQVGAANLLTTAMNQYGVSLDDPMKASSEMAKMMNVMAAAAAEGSAELPQQKEALQQSGMAAKAANVSFEETAAAIQVLDKAGKKGSEGGVALRNTLAKLSEGRFLPKDVQAELQKAGVNINTLGDKTLTMADRMKPLRAIMNDSALVTKLFGAENSNAALALINGIEEQERLTAAVSGTNAAYEQAAIIMESPAEKNARLQAQIDDFKISLFNATNGWIGYAEVAAETASTIADLTPLFGGMMTVIKTVTSAQKMQALWTSICSGATAVWAGIQAGFNAIMAVNPIVWVVLAVVALVAAIIWVANATQGWGELWEHTVNGSKALFMAFVEGTKANFNTMVQGIMIGINKIKQGWYEFKEAVGLGESSDNQKMLAQIAADTEARKKSIKEGYEKAAAYGVEAAKEFKLAVGSLSWKEEEKEGIEDPTMPGTGKVPGDGKGGGGSPAATKANQAIATGGTKHNYITINLKEMIGIKADTVNGSKKDVDNVGTQLKDELLRVIATATTAGN